MIQALLYIRVKQIFRLLSQAGILRSIVILGLLLFALAYMFQESADKPEVYVVSTLFLVAILVTHRSRRDFNFLKTYTINPKTICFVEYFIFSCPLIITLLIYGWWWFDLLYLAGLLLIVQTDGASFFSKKTSQYLIELIPVKCYEWKVGFRKTQYVIVILWLLGALGSFHVAAVPVTIFLLGFIIQSFYEKHEPYQLIMALGQGENLFLWSKVKWLVLLFSILILPLAILHSIYHPQLWYLVGIEYLLFVSWYIYTLFSKYAFYNPKNTFSGSQAYAMIGLLAFFIPLFLPLSWVMAVRFYFKSKSSLSIYLHDFN